jgi:cobyrinic acid a,c-diamide synthase
VLIAHDVDMAGAVIVRVDDDPVAQELQDCCHDIKNLSCLGFFTPTGLGRFRLEIAGRAFRDLLGPEVGVPL